MPLDPVIEGLLAQLAKAGTPGMDKMSVGDARAFVSGMGGGAAMEDVGSLNSRTIDGVSVREYRGADVAPEAPIFLWFHGGGFVVGDVERAEPAMRRLANRVPARIVSVEYRLAPEHPFPAAIEDARRVFAWAVGETTQVAVGGDSAGGNLASLLACEARDGGIRLQHQVLVNPWLDLTLSQPSTADLADGYILTRSVLQWFAGHYLSGAVDPADPAISPIYIANVSGLAPATILTAEFDPLRDDGELYSARLRAGGVDVEARRFDGMIHGFFGFLGVTDVADEANDLVAARLRGAFAPRR